MSGFVIAKPTSFAQAADLVAERRYELPMSDSPAARAMSVGKRR